MSQQTLKRVSQLLAWVPAGAGSQGTLPARVGGSLQHEAPTGVKSREKLALNCAVEAVWSQHNTKLQTRRLGLQKNSHLRS